MWRKKVWSFYKQHQWILAQHSKQKRIQTNDTKGNQKEFNKLSHIRPMSFNSSVIVMTQEETVHNPLQKHRSAFPTEAKWLRPPSWSMTARRSCVSGNKEWQAKNTSQSGLYRTLADTSWRSNFTTFSFFAPQGDDACKFSAVGGLQEKKKRNKR